MLIPYIFVHGAENVQSVDHLVIDLGPWFQIMPVPGLTKVHAVEEDCGSDAVHLLKLIMCIY